MSDLSITVQIKSVYGDERIYPICEKAKAFASLTGCKTLTRVAIGHIKALGYVVNVQTTTPATL
jgi:hypothetical protein